MSISVTDAKIFIPEDTTLTDILISWSVIRIDNEAMVTLAGGARISHCDIIAPRPRTSIRPAIFVEDGDVSDSHMDTREEL